MSFRKKKKQKIVQTAKPGRSKIENDKLPDVILEQTETPLTTTHCPQSVKEGELSNVKKNPDSYIEINMISNRIVDNFYIKLTHRSFKYKTKTYNIDEKKIYLLPTKSGFLMLTSFYKQGDPKPKSFDKTNKGITSKALSILYNDSLYYDLFAPDETKYNFIIAVFLIVNTILYAGGIFLQYKGDTL